MVKDKDIEIPNIEELKKFSFKVNGIGKSPSIQGVYSKKLITNVDGRGDLTELWSKPWSDKEPVASNIEHVYFNTTHEGIVKGWHIHKFTESQYTCVLGKMQVVLVDLRRDSGSFLNVDQFILGTKAPGFIRIPAGVLKAWKSLQGDSVIINLLTSSILSDNYKFPPDIILQDIWEPKNA
jgi:dTDP-4-dehydrorhamnose 3,5-epimerase